MISMFFLTIYILWTTIFYMKNWYLKIDFICLKIIPQSLDKKTLNIRVLHKNSCIYNGGYKIQPCIILPSSDDFVIVWLFTGYGKVRVRGIMLNFLQKTARKVIPSIYGMNPHSPSCSIVISIECTKMLKNLLMTNN